VLASRSDTEGRCSAAPPVAHALRFVHYRSRRAGHTRGPQPPLRYRLNNSPRRCSLRACASCSSPQGSAEAGSHALRSAALTAAQGLGPFILRGPFPSRSMRSAPCEPTPTWPPVGRPRPRLHALSLLGSFYRGALRNGRHRPAPLMRLRIAPSAVAWAHSAGASSGRSPAALISAPLLPGTPLFFATIAWRALQSVAQPAAAAQ